MSKHSILDAFAPTQQKGISAYADYLEAVVEMAKLPNEADATLRSRLRRRFDEIQDFALDAVRKAGFPVFPGDLAHTLIKERRAHRRICERQRRERLAQRELLAAALS